MERYLNAIGQNMLESMKYVFWHMENCCIYKFMRSWKNDVFLSGNISLTFDGRGQIFVIFAIKTYFCWQTCCLCYTLGSIRNDSVRSAMAYE